MLMSKPNGMMNKTREKRSKITADLAANPLIAVWNGEKSKVAQDTHAKAEKH